MIHLILHLAPYGAFALTASVVGTQGIGAIQNLGMLIFALLIAMLVQYLIFGVMIAVFAKLSPIVSFTFLYYKQLAPLRLSSQCCGSFRSWNFCQSTQKLHIASPTGHFVRKAW